MATTTFGERAQARCRPDVTCFIPDLGDGGAQRAAIKLAGGLAARGLAVDLVLLKGRLKNSGDRDLLKRANGHCSGIQAGRTGELARAGDDIGARIIELTAGRVVTAIPGVVQYLRREQPRALVSFLSHANVAAIAACALARVETRLVVVEQNTVSAVRSTFRKDVCLPTLIRRFYPRAHAVVGVSEGVASDLVSQLGIPAGKVSVIYNPVVDDALVDGAAMEPDHRWFADNSIPIFVAAGRLNVQKDFPTLLRAFRMLREKRPVRLIILGEGEERAHLEELIAAMNLTDDVALPGFTENPYAYMSRAVAFVLSSRWEGLPTVLIEALVCGCPVISTDCPSGPREILSQGHYGTLVPVGDVGAMSEAMGRALDAPRRADELKAHASRYSVERAVSQYLRLLDLS